MSETTNQPTPEQLARWARIDKLDSSAFAGRELSQEEFTVKVESMMNGDALIQHLANIRKKRHQLIAEVASLEKYEEWLENHIRETLGKEAN